MANRETRKEQYEDALFALLMDEMAQEDGEELLRLNEALKQDPNAAVPEAVHHRCEKDSPVVWTAPPGRHPGNSSVFGGLCPFGGCACGHAEHRVGGDG